MTFTYVAEYCTANSTTCMCQSCDSTVQRNLCDISDHLRRIRTNETDRSLVELTGDRDVFLNLHKYFVFLLKAGGQRIVEVVLEGPPPVMAKAEPSRSFSLSDPEEDIWQTLDRPVSAPEFSVVTG